MPQKIIFEHKDGTSEEVDCLHFQINESQQVVVLAVDFDHHPEVRPFSLPGVEATRMGKLNDQQIIFGMQLSNSMQIHAWDWDNFRNPEVIILTDNRIKNENHEQQENH